jgi:hypothetical protein
MYRRWRQDTLALISAKATPATTVAQREAAIAP